MKVVPEDKVFDKKPNRTQMMAFTAMIFAVAIVLSIIESMFPPIIGGVPGVKLGLSNIAVMYCLFFLGRKQAYSLVFLKATFVFITRGAVAGLLSFSGGLLSITVIIVLMLIFKEHVSYLILSIFGAISHNIGQFAAIMLLYYGVNMWPYLPVLLGFGVVAGIVTATLLKVILPALQKLVRI